MKWPVFADIDWVRTISCVCWIDMAGVLPRGGYHMAAIKALTRDRHRLLETRQTVESRLRMVLEAYHPAPVRLFSSLVPSLPSGR